MVKSEQRLAGFRVLVTRPRDRARELCFLLEDEGAEVLSMPLLDFLPPSDERPLRAAAERISRYSWIVLSSPYGAAALTEAARSAGTEANLRTARCGAIGPSTARAARGLGFNVVVESEVSTSDGMFESLRSHLGQGDEILLPSAENGRTELEQHLREAGFAVTRIAAYQTAKVPKPKQWEEIVSSVPDAVVFASPRTAEAFSALPDSGRVLRTAAIVAIGPTTAEALKVLLVVPSAIAAQPTAEAVVEAVVLAMQARNKTEERH